MSLVEDVRKQIESRIKELKPLVDEYHQLEQMATGLVGDARDIVTGRGRGGSRRSLPSSASSSPPTRTPRAPARRAAEEAG